MNRPIVAIAICCAFATAYPASPAHSEVEPTTQCAAEPGSTTIAYGDHVHCEIESNIDGDAFTFQGINGDKIWITVARRDGGSICADVRRPDDGSRLTSSCTDHLSRDPSFEANLDRTGTWTLRITGSGGGEDGILPYDFTVERIFPYPTGVAICPGCFRSGDTDPHPDYDFFAFEMKSSGQMILTPRRTTSGSVCIHLRKGPNLVSSGCTDHLSRDPTIDVPVSEPGEYLVIVWGSTGVSYNLSIECLPGTSCADEAHTCNGETATIIGTDGDNILTGTDDRDVIVARGGNDIIYGLGGEDLICGDAGNDLVFGGDGDDRILGGRGDDLLLGQGDNDRLSGSSGNDLLSGGGGDDNMNGGSGGDVCDGGPHVLGDSAAGNCDQKLGVAP